MGHFYTGAHNKRLSPYPDGRRHKVESIKRLTKKRLDMYREEISPEDLEHLDMARPKTRADCENGIRPCPFVGCSMNTYLDVSDHTGAIKLNRPDIAPEDIHEDQSCALDFESLGGATLEDVGIVLGMTRERVRQIEHKGIAHLKQRGGRALEALRGQSIVRPKGDWTDAERGVENTVAAGWKMPPKADEAQDEPVVDEARGPAWKTLDIHEDERAVNAFFNIYLKDSRANGFGGIKFDSDSKRRLEETVAKIEQRRRIVDAYRTLSVGGKEPSTMDVAKAANLTGSPRSQSVSVGRTISFARKSGELPKVKR